jgi:hypothetical protein
MAARFWETATMHGFGQSASLVLLGHPILVFAR